MPAPNKSLATLRPDLGTFVEYDLAASHRGFIGLSIFPVLEVAVQSDVFGKIKAESLLETKKTARAPGGAYGRGGHDFEDDSYACVENGFEEPVDEREAKMYANYFDAEQFATLRARDVVLRNQEIRIAAKVFDTNTYTPTPITHEWDDPANADPIGDVKKAKIRAYENRGVMLDTLVIAWTTFVNLQHCESILERIAANGAGGPIEPAKITRAKIAEVLDLRQVLVGDAQVNDAGKGQAMDLSPIWSKEYAMVCRAAQTRDIREVCIGRTFHWGEDGSKIGGLVESYDEAQTRSTIIRCRMDTHEKTMYDAAGELLSNIYTSG